MGTWCSYPKSCTAEEEQEEQEQEIAAAILGLEFASSERDLHTIAARLGHRLVVNVERNQVIVLGGCKGDLPNAITAMAPDQMRVLAASGLRTYQEFLTDQVVQAELDPA